jgi:hypothetical protein
MGPGMSVTTKEPDRQVVGDPVIDADGRPSRGEVIALCAVIAIDRDEITPAVDPHAPAVFRRGLKDRWLRDNSLSIFLKMVSLPEGGAAGGIVDTNPVEPLWISARRSSRLNLCVLVPEKLISNREVNCSAVGSRIASKGGIGNGSSGFMGGSGSGMTSIMGGLGFGVGGAVK